MERFPIDEVFFKRLEHLRGLRIQIEFLLSSLERSRVDLSQWESEVRSIRNMLAEEKQLDDMLNSAKDTGKPLTS